MRFMQRTNGVWIAAGRLSMLGGRWIILSEVQNELATPLNSLDDVDIRVQSSNASGSLVIVTNQIKLYKEF